MTRDEAVERAKSFLTTRAQAYRRTFEGPVPERVLRDLARFCRAHQSTAHQDPQVAARLDGRREVWLRIQEHLQLTDEELWELRRPE